MKYATAILILFLINSVAFAQNHTVALRIFHSHNQNCNIAGTTEEDFVIQLFNDSTIKMIKYSSNYKDNYNSVRRDQFIGKYNFKHDTLVVKYLSKSSQTKYKKQPNFKFSNDSLDIIISYPPSDFIVNSNSIFSIGDLSINLKEISFVNYVLDQKYDCWDKSASNKKEIFGITN